jgi:hypothetical protein
MFKVGDKVKWSDEENGRQKERHGTVVEVVAIRRRPDRNRFPSLYSKSSGFGFARDHECNDPQSWTILRRFQLHRGGDVLLPPLGLKLLRAQIS